MLSIENLPAIFKLIDFMRETIKVGVKTGLVDAKTGRAHKLIDGFIEDLKN